jgi:hypothetical protein
MAGAISTILCAAKESEKEMKVKDLAKASVGVGAVALLGLTSPACGSTTPQGSESQPTQTDTAQPAESASESQPTQTGTAQPAESAAPADGGAVESQGAQETPPATSGEQSKVANEPEGQSKVDCSRPNTSPECGYASPTRYAVLDPRRIVNS